MTKNDKDQQQTADDQSQPDEGVAEDTAQAVSDEEMQAPAENELEQVRAERDRYLDQLQRSVAEFANFRRRNEQERAQMTALIRRDVLTRFLPIIDDFERAMAQVPDDARDSGWVTGLTMIESKFKGVLDQADVHALNPVGELFDPAGMEAVATDPDTDGSTVTEVYQKGYRIGDMLIRPAMVKTGAASEATT